MLDRQAMARNGNDVVYQRLVFLDGFIYGERGADVLDYRTRIDGQGAGGNLPAYYRVDELFFTALRIAFLERDDFNLGKSFAAALIEAMASGLFSSIPR